MNILIKNALTLTVNQNNDVLKNSDIAVEDGLRPVHELRTRAISRVDFSIEKTKDCVPSIP